MTDKQMNLRLQMIDRILHCNQIVLLTEHDGDSDIQWDTKNIKSAIGLIVAANQYIDRL